MSNKPKNSATKIDAGGRHPARPFKAALWSKAEKAGNRYRIVIWFEDGEWYGRGLELPLTMSDGATLDQCVANVREAMTLTVASMLEDGETPAAAQIPYDPRKIRRSARAG